MYAPQLDKNLSGLHCPTFMPSPTLLRYRTVPYHTTPYRINQFQTLLMKKINPVFRISMLIQIRIQMHFRSMRI